MKIVWNGVLSNPKNKKLVIWVQRFCLSSFKFLSMFVMWGIWLGRNRVLFQNDVACSAIIAHNYGVSFLEQVKPLRSKKTRIIRELVLSKGNVWDFFDDACQRENCEVGIVILFP